VQLHHACKSKIKAGMVSVREMEQNRMSFKSLIQNKKEERELIAQQIRTYLAKGNHIKVYPVGTTGINHKKMNEVWEKKFRNNLKKGESYDRR
tara:strand:+ start:696 stop:974 length:279 start_codon:yes stop_codon:yes gene_type:complete